MKLIVSDLDGTLYPRKDTENTMQFQDNLNAIKKWLDKGNQFAVATARGLHHYPVLSEKLGFPVHFIGGNGSTTQWITGETIIKEFPRSVFIELCKFVEDNHINASVATGINNDWVWSSNHCYPRGEERYKDIWDSIVIAKLDEIDPTLGLPRIQIFTPKENRDILKEKIVQKNYPVQVTTSDIDMIEIIPLNCSKGIFILELCKKSNIEQENLIVIGDSENDIPMFEITKHSYCIDKAEQSVREKASKVVKSVAEVIELEMK